MHLLKLSFIGAFHCVQTLWEMNKPYLQIINFNDMHAKTFKDEVY